MKLSFAARKAASAAEQGLIIKNPIASCHQTKTKTLHRKGREGCAKGAKAYQPLRGLRVHCVAIASFALVGCFALRASERSGTGPQGSTHSLLSGTAFRRAGIP